MKNTRYLLPVLLATHGVIASGAEPERRDKGWMAHNMSGSCEVVRGGQNIDPSDTTKQVLTIQFFSDPRDTLAIHHGETMLSFALFGEKGAMLNEEVESFSLLEGAVNSASALVVTPTTDRRLSFVLAEKAESTLRLLAAERLVRVQRKDGSASVFRFPVKGYATSRAMFDACVQTLRTRA